MLESSDLAAQFNGGGVAEASDLAEITTSARNLFLLGFYHRTQLPIMGSLSGGLGRILKWTKN